MQDLLPAGVVQERLSAMPGNVGREDACQFIL